MATFFAVLADPAFKTADVIGAFPTRRQAERHGMQHPNAGPYWQPRAWSWTELQKMRGRGWDVKT